MKKIITFIILIISIAFGSNMIFSILQQPPKGLKGKIIFKGSILTSEGKVEAIGIYNNETEEENTIMIKGGNARLSPDGFKILYEDEKNIYIMNSDGTNRTIILCKNESEYIYTDASWSPAGDKIIFKKVSRKKDGQEEGIYIMDIDEGTFTKIIGYEMLPRTPSFSPIGDKIAFIGYFPEELREGKITSRLFIADTDGRNIASVNKIDGVETYAWSPTGKQFVYISEKDYQLHIVNIDNFADIVITDLKSCGWSCLWSPDGTKIIFDYIPPPFVQSPTEIYMINVDGTGLKRFYPKGKWTSISSPQWWAPKK